MQKSMLQLVNLLIANCCKHHSATIWYRQEAREDEGQREQKGRNLIIFPLPKEPPFALRCIAKMKQRVLEISAGQS